MTVLPPALAPLAAYRQFLNYKLVPSRTKPGKMDKLPVSPLGAGDVPPGGVCDAHDVAHHVDYATAAACSPLVAFVFTDADPFWFLDIDGAYDPATGWSEVSQQLLTYLPGVAVEVSQSQTGLHLFGTGQLPDHMCRNIRLGLELYHTGRFVALTGLQTQGDASVAPEPYLLEWLVSSYFAPNTPLAHAVPEWSAGPVAEWAGPADDDELIRIARRNAQKNVKVALGDPNYVSFIDLWDVNVDKLANRYPSSGDSPYDRSSADAALAANLAYWTGRDCERIERLMRRSGLMRDKWDQREDYYLPRTIVNACGITANVYQQPEAKPPAPVPPIATQTAATFSNGWSGQADKQDCLFIETMIVGLTGGVPRYDMFADRFLLHDGTIVDDHVERKLWIELRNTSMQPVAKELFSETFRNTAYANSFHPVRDYLDHVQQHWDGVPRINTWLRDFASADTHPEYLAAVSSIWLIAAVRRVRQPGVLFQEMLVLESPQGFEKSTALASLCHDPDWFTDALHMGMSQKEVIETVAGKWIVEAPELSKLKDGEIEHVKSMIARRFDRARLAYGRYTTERGRQCVFGGSTNADAYLRDPTGNRRFWPVAVGRFDIPALVAARDQLWAEAAVREARGESIRLPQPLWNVAQVIQEQRLASDPVADVIRAHLHGLEGAIRSDDLWHLFGNPNLSEKRRLGSSVGMAMQAAGWVRTRRREDQDRHYFYEKGNSARRLTWDMMKQQIITEPANLTVVAQ